MFTLMKIFLKVDWPSINEVKAGVKAKEDDKNKRYKNELTTRKASLLICYHKHQYRAEEINAMR